MQLGAAIGAVVYTAVLSALILKTIDVTIGLRVDEQEESRGLDIALHEESGYRL